MHSRAQWVSPLTIQEHSHWFDSTTHRLFSSKSAHLRAPRTHDAANASHLPRLTCRVHQFCAQCDAVVVLLTRRLLDQPSCLVDIVEAVSAGKLLVTIYVDRGGYDFAAALRKLDDLEHHFASVGESALSRLLELLPQVTAM